MRVQVLLNICVKPQQGNHAVGFCQREGHSLMGPSLPILLGPMLFEVLVCLQEWLFLIFGLFQAGSPLKQSSIGSTFSSGRPNAKFSLMPQTDPRSRYPATMLSRNLPWQDTCMASSLRNALPDLANDALPNMSELCFFFVWVAKLPIGGKLNISRSLFLI